MDDCGGAFTMGAIGGGIFQAVKGFRNAPSVSSTLKVNIVVFCLASQSIIDLSLSALLHIDICMMFE